MARRYAGDLHTLHLYQCDAPCLGPCVALDSSFYSNDRANDGDL